MSLTVAPEKPSNRLAYTLGFSHMSLELVSNNFLPVVYPLLIASMGLTYSQIGRLVLVISIFGALTQPLFGWLSDRWQPRVIVPISIAWTGAIMGLSGLVDNYTVLIAVIALAMLGSAAFHPAGASIVTYLPARTRGWSMAIFSVGGNVGSAGSPVLVGFALGGMGLAGTAVVVPVAILAAVAVHLNFQANREVVSVERHNLRKETGEGSAAGQSAPIVALGAIILIIGARSWVQGSLGTYMPEWLQGQGATVALSGAVLAGYRAAMAIGSLLGGYLADRTRKTRVVLITLVGLIPSVWLFLNTTGGVQFAAALLVGALIGGTFPLTILMAQDVWPDRVGLAASIIFGIGWLPSGLGSLVVGRIADVQGLTAALSTVVPVPLVGILALAIFLWRRRGLQE